MLLTTTIKISIVIVIVALTGGCVTGFEDSTQKALIAHMIRQNAIIEQQKTEQEKIEAVKKFQIEAIQLGFATWIVDDYGNVKFRWAMWKVKK